MDNNVVLDDISKLLDRVSKLTGAFCPGDTPNLGSMIVRLEDLFIAAAQHKSETFSKVTNAGLHYAENMTLETMSNTKPLEDALLLMEAIFRHMKKGIEFTFETQDIMDILESAILTSPPKSQLPDGCIQMN